MGNVQTRQFDNRGMAHRRGSISWNFRYPPQRRRDLPTMMVYNAKLSVSDWLELLDLQQYEANFQLYNRVEHILELSDNDLKCLGIRNAAHRSKMLSSLVGVRAKRRQSMNIEVSSAARNLPKRKNSCPPIYLTDLRNAGGNLFDSKTLGRSYASSNRSSSAPSKKSSVDHIYEEITPKQRATLTTAASTNTLTNNDNNKDTSSSSSSGSSSNSSSSRSSCNMENGSTPHLSISPTTTTAAPISHQPSCINATPASASTANATNEQHEAVALKKALEWELSLDSRDLRSHAWYHGPLPRQRAEEIVQRDGDFLIRDCASQPDNYVLTCRTKTTVLHFVINKILLQPETVYERVQYQFEEDAFDAIPDLITFYVGSGKAISAASGALIQYPCNRTYPLSFYGHKIVGNHLHMQMLSGIRGASPLNSPLSSNGGGSFRFGASASAPQHLPHQQQNQSPMSSPPRVKRDNPPRLPSKKQRSQSLTPAQAMVVSNMRNAEMCSSTDGGFQGNGNGDIITAPNGRRFSNFEKSNSIGEVSGELPLHVRLEQLTHGKIHNNGFQTIARCTASDAVDHFKFTTHSLPRPTTNFFRQNRFGRTSSLARDLSTDSSSLFTSLEGKQIPELPEQPPSPPPKPTRAPTLPRKEKDFIFDQQQHALHRAAAAAAAAAVYQASGSDSGNGSGDSIQSSAPGDFNEFSHHRGVIIKNPRFMSNSASSATLKSLTEFDINATEEQLFIMELPEVKPVTKFDFENFNTLLLPAVDNKPLDGDALSTFKMMLLETGPKMIAEHITRIDVGLLIDEDSDENENNVLNCCGLEMLTLPQGKVFRNDLIERTQSIKLMVAVTILTCQTDLDRAELLSKWIQIAVETKTALGNLFGFCAIMLGLCMQQIQKLDNAWHILRQKYTDSAFTFEAKLRPTLISMNECSNPQAPNTTVPHVLIYALLKDRPVIDIINVNNPAEQSSLHTTCITSWEKKADDFGLAINFLHLDSARGFLRSLELYRKNSRIILEESNSRMDELLSDAFRTEFHVLFLWGSAGALASAEDRHTKLEKVLALMADKFCSIANSTTGA